MQRALLCIMLIAVLSARVSRAQDHTTPALAVIEGNDIVVRQFNLPQTPLPGVERVNSPRVEPNEYRMKFAQSEVQFFHVDGRPVAADVWRPRLREESPILFASHAATPAGQPVQPPTRIELTPEHSIYQSDALVLLGLCGPHEHQQVEQPSLPGARPRFGTGTVLSNRWLRVVERQQTRSHYYGGLPDQSIPQAHVFQTVALAVTRDVDFAQTRVTQLDGRPLSAGEAAAALQGSPIVVISADGAAVDPFYLRLIRPGTYVVYFPVLPPQPVDRAPPANGVQAPAPSPY